MIFGADSLGRSPRVHVVIINVLADPDITSHFYVPQTMSRWAVKMDPGHEISDAAQ